VRSLRRLLLPTFDLGKDLALVVVDRVQLIKSCALLLLCSAANLVTWDFPKNLEIWSRWVGEFDLLTMEWGGGGDFWFWLEMAAGQRPAPECCVNFMNSGNAHSTNLPRFGARWKLGDILLGSSKKVLRASVNTPLSSRLLFFLRARTIGWTPATHAPDQRFATGTVR
jgi:hypothetical protein